MDTTKLKKPKPEHRFFERFLDNNLEDLFIYLVDKQKDLLDGKIGDIPSSRLSQFTEKNGPATQLGTYYNVFSFNNASIDKLKDELNLATREACEYYGIDFDAQEYYIRGWFNLDYESPPNKEDGVSPMVSDENYHDHMDGSGAPDFHGYYCVNAEPSKTYYKINKERHFENINKNNRAVLSETGHPHGRDDWYDTKPRITIAYDITPGKSESNWVKL